MAKYRADIKGVMVPNSYKMYYKWLGIECTCPKDVNDILAKTHPGDDVEVYINSGGGVIDVGSEIYTALRSASEKCNVKIFITGQACSAASVAACAGYCEMSPTALMMVHCVSSTVENGNHNAMEHMAEALSTADRAMCTAYTAKTGMSEAEALDMMEHETWLTAEQAKERGLVDGIMFQEEENLQPMVDSLFFRLPTQEQLDRVKTMMGEAAVPTAGRVHDDKIMECTISSDEIAGGFITGIVADPAKAQENRKEELRQKLITQKLSKRLNIKMEALK